MICIMNPPYGAGLHKKIFNKACSYSKVFSLQPLGSWKTQVGEKKNMD